MFDLNDIYRKFDLKGRKQPSDWRGKTKDKLFETANLRVEKGGRDKDGTPSTKTLATLEALYAYAMWVDVAFYMVVVEAFAALTKCGHLTPLRRTFDSQSLRQSRPLTLLNKSSQL